MKNFQSLKVARLLGATFAISLLPFSAHAYDVFKVLTLTTTNAIEVSTYVYCHAWVVDNLPDGSTCVAEQHKPATQGSNYNPYGKDSMQLTNSSGIGTNFVTTNGVLTNLVLNTAFDGKSSNSVILAKSNITFSGMTLVKVHEVAFTQEAHSPPCDSVAYAASDIDLRLVKTGSTNSLMGTNEVHGYARAVKGAKDHKAYAFSTAVTLAHATNLLYGHIFLHKFSTNDPAGKPGKRTQDPVQFTLRDRVTGAVTNGFLFNYVMVTTATGAGGFSWDNNQVQISAPNMDFSLDLPGQFTSVAGHVDLQVRNGQVSVSEATGIYAGMLPPIGTVIPLNFALNNDLDFDFDLSSLSLHDSDVYVYVSCTGEEYDEYNAGPIPLAITVAGGSPTLSWPLTARVWQLQTSMNLGPAADWMNVTGSPIMLSNDTFSVTLPAGDAQGFFRLLMVGPFCEVNISQQPQNVFTGQGGLATFTVEASGSPSFLTYQWQEKVVGGVFQDIPGATSSSYSRPVFSPDNGSQFRCLVTNDCEYKYSQPATLTVF